MIGVDADDGVGGTRWRMVAEVAGDSAVEDGGGEGGGGGGGDGGGDGGGLGGGMGQLQVLSIVSHELAGPSVPHVYFA